MKALLKKDIFAFFLALIISALLTPLIRYLAIKYKIFDKPDYRKMHKVPVPQLGGIAIFIGFVGSLLAFVPLDKELIGILIGGFVIVVLGVVDDVYILTPKIKLIGQAIATAIVIYSGVKIEYITNLVKGDMYFLEYLSIPLTFIWIIGITNTINLIDGLDGLAAGVSFIAALTLVAVGYIRELLYPNSVSIHYTITLSSILAGAAIGFLKYNMYPAKIFMGDTGSMFLGFNLAVIAVVGAFKGPALATIVIPLLALGVPIFDTLLAIIRRKKSNMPIFKPDKEHFHHQCLEIGLTHRQTVFIIYFISTLLGCWAILLTSEKSLYALFTLLFIVLLFALGTVRIKRIRDRLRHSQQEQSQDKE